MAKREVLPPTVLVIFGITGDLSHRYLLPALSEIAKSGLLNKDFKIIGVSRHEAKVDDVFRAEEANLKPYAQMLKVDLKSAGDYKKLAQQIDQTVTDKKGQVIFYLSVPPEATDGIIELLGLNGLNRSNMKLLLEKPFGNDLASAEELVEGTAKYFTEEQVYRIDHYLAKEMAQNITVFLGSNALFRDVWNRQFIEKIEILVAESISIEGRVNFYENTGALRDIGQSHLLQLAALVLMEPCSDIFDFDEIPRRRLKALKHLSLNGQALRGQYRGYTKEVANPDSRIETFVAFQAKSSDPRWRGVPIKMATGKSLDKRLTQIKVCFKKTPSGTRNDLFFRIQPNEAIEFDLWVKEPGYERKLQKLRWNFAYDQHFSTRLPNAYEMVIVDAMRSNHSLFASSAEVIASWRILQPLLDRWQKSAKDLLVYQPGSDLDQILGLAEKA